MANLLKRLKKQKIMRKSLIRKMLTLHLTANKRSKKLTTTINKMINPRQDKSNNQKRDRIKWLTTNQQLTPQQKLRMPRKMNKSQHIPQKKWMKQEASKISQKSQMVWRKPRTPQIPRWFHLPMETKLTRIHRQQIQTLRIRRVVLTQKTQQHQRIRKQKIHPK